MQEIIDNQYEKLKEFFTTPTRNIRRNLLMASSILFMLVIVNPKTIKGFLGFTFSESTPHYIPIGALSIVVLYEFVAFILYAINDWQAWKLKPYEKTYLFTETKLSEISQKIEEASKNITIKKVAGLEQIAPADIEVKINPIYFPRLINQAKYSTEDSIHQSDAEREIILTDSKVIAELENTFRKEAEEQIKQTLSKRIDEKMNELNSLVKLESEQYTNKVNKLISDSEKSIKSSTDSYISSSKRIMDLVKEVENEIKNYHKGINQFNFFHKSKIWIIDIIVPIILSILSIYSSVDEIKLFIKYILDRLF